MAKSELDLRELAEQYGITYDEINANPELKAKFQQAVKEDWSPTKFTAVLRNTNWWKTTDDTTRKFIDLKTGDPATWRSQWEATADRVNRLAVSVGLADMSGTGYNFDSGMNKILRDATWAAMAGGWTDDRLKAYFGGQLQFKAGVPMSGDAGRTYMQIQSLAYANGRTYTDQWYQDQIRAIEGGKSTIEATEQLIRQQAADDYKGFSKQILAGQNALDLAAPYTKAVSDLLEIPQGSLGMDDSLVRKAMTSTDKDGNPYSLWQLQNDIRNDERWKKTNNARESVGALAHNVLSTFGLVI